MHANRAHFSKIRALFFLQNQGAFFYFQKWARDTCPFPIASCAPDIYLKATITRENTLRFRTYIQKCTLPRLVILIITSKLSKE